MWEPTLRNRGHLQHARGSTGPGLTVLVGCFGYMFWDLMVERRNQKRRTEIHQEIVRRVGVVSKGTDELLKQIKLVRDKDELKD